VTEREQQIVAAVARLLAKDYLRLQDAKTYGKALERENDGNSKSPQPRAAIV
jgi:hypothetical protein